MADDCTESADGCTVGFDRYTKYMKWENAGVVSAINSWTLEDLKNTGFPQQAYELGKRI